MATPNYEKIVDSFYEAQMRNAWLLGRLVVAPVRCTPGSGKPPFRGEGCITLSQPRLLKLKRCVDAIRYLAEDSPDGKDLNHIADQLEELERAELICGSMYKGIRKSGWPYFNIYLSEHARA